MSPVTSISLRHTKFTNLAREPLNATQMASGLTLILIKLEESRMTDEVSLLQKIF